jgi:hypothetical protein
MASCLKKLCKSKDAKSSAVHGKSKLRLHRNISLLKISSYAVFKLRKSFRACSKNNGLYKLSDCVGNFRSTLKSGSAAVSGITPSGTVAHLKL